MTGDRGSFVAQSPFNRIAAHLDERPKSRNNHLRQHLSGREILIDCCDRIEVAAYGPIGTVPRREEYQAARGKVEAIEKELWRHMKKAGLDMINGCPTCRSTAAPIVLDAVLRAFIPFLEAN
jgi:hypothetical protein